MKQAIVALGLVEWEAAFVSGLGHPMLGMSVQRRCVDGVDVRAAIQVVATDVVIVSDYTPRIDQDLMNELHDKNIDIFAIGDDENYWLDLGATKFIELDLENPLRAINKIAEALRANVVTPQEENLPKGEFIAVAGFGGACGRSTLVKELSWQLAATGSKTLMVDADTYGPSLAQELGIAAAGAGLLEVCRQFEKRNLTVKPFDNSAQVIASNLSLLPGLARTSRWTDLRIPALRTTWENAQTNFDFVVTDVGGVLEIDHSLMHEASLPRRHAAALTALAAATSTIICARADSIGISRLIKGYLEFHELFANSNVSAVVWGTSSDRNAKEVTQAITRHTGLSAVTCIPHDWELSSSALAGAITMSSIAPKSEIAQKYKSVAESMIQNEVNVVSLENKKRARSGIRNKRAA